MATTRKYITLQQFADFHQVSVTLIREFADFGLIEIRQTENISCIYSDDMEKYERAIRLHKELGVNKEGIEIIIGMREKLTTMQNELNRLRHLLKKHEDQMLTLFPKEFFDVE